MNTTTVLDLIVLTEKNGSSRLFSECVAGKKGLSNKITNSINRPGLALNGIFNIFGEDRIQLFGVGEIRFLHQLEKEKKLFPILEEFFKHSISCCIVSHTPKNLPPKSFLEFCEKQNCPLIYSELPTNEVSSRLYRLLNIIFAPKTVVHGVFMEICDLGVLITGESGVGKSETALGLLDRRSSRMVSDDVVLLEKVNESTILGKTPDITQYKHHIEIRGVGFINISQIYGVNVMLKEKTLSLIINLKFWKKGDEQTLDRLENEHTNDIMGVKIPYVEIPVRIGRNIPLIVETAVIKQRLKFMGYHGKEDPFLW